MKAMIFAAGLGTRLKPLTDQIPKALVPVGGRPLLEHLLLKMKRAGITDVTINVHHFAGKIKEFLAENRNFDINISISDETDMLLDTGGGLKKALPLLDGNEPILVHNVDILSNLDFGILIAAHRLEDGATLVVSQRATSRYLLFDENQRLCGWVNTRTAAYRPDTLVERPEWQRLAFSGIQIITPRLLHQLDKMPMRFSIIDFYLHIMAMETLRAYVPTDYRMLDVGKTDTLAEANSFISKL